VGRFGWGRKLGVFDGRPIPAHIDGVHDRQCAAYAEDEAEEDTDERAGIEVHGLMVCPGLLIPVAAGCLSSCSGLLIVL
jgi:hypothetical protein